MQRKAEQQKTKHRRAAQRRKRDLKGFVVHWKDPQDATGSIQFHPEFLPFTMASAMAKSLSMAGMPAVVSPMICKDYRASIADIKKTSPAPIELKILNLEQ